MVGRGAVWKERRVEGEEGQRERGRGSYSESIDCVHIAKVLRTKDHEETTLGETSMIVTKHAHEYD